MGRIISISVGYGMNMLGLDWEEEGGELLTLGAMG